jgi:NADH:ubiquinone oxidoreductase subunit
MRFINNIFIKSFCKQIGSDHFGNAYFESKNSDYLGNRRRYVVYNDELEPSKVPPLWHAWLHYLSNEVPTNDNNQFKWQQDYIPNLTGTKHSYSPQGSDKHRQKVSADYTSWQPKY